jgi:hypothetical protein
VSTWLPHFSQVKTAMEGPSRFFCTLLAQVQAWGYSFLSPREKV